MELLEKSSPLIIAEIKRWRYLLWDDYIEHKSELDREQRLKFPSSIHTPAESIDDTSKQENVKVYASRSPNDLDFGKSPYDFELSGHLRS